MDSVVRRSGKWLKYLYSSSWSVLGTCGGGLEGKARKTLVDKYTQEANRITVEEHSKTSFPCMSLCQTSLTHHRHDSKGMEFLKPFYFSIIYIKVMTDECLNMTSAIMEISWAIIRYIRFFPPTPAGWQRGGPNLFLFICLFACGGCTDWFIYPVCDMRILLGPRCVCLMTVHLPCLFYHQTFKSKRCASKNDGSVEQTEPKRKQTVPLQNNEIISPRHLMLLKRCMKMRETERRRDGK